MPAQDEISVEEYLRTSYRPDCDYIDGHIEERNLGEWDHANLQTAIAIYFGNRRKQWGINVVVEQRVQVSPTRFRIPDVCVILGEPDGQILRKPPFICIEVVSPEDRLNRLEQRIEDFLADGRRLRLGDRSPNTQGLRGYASERAVRSQDQHPRDRKPRDRASPQ